MDINMRSAVTARVTGVPRSVFMFIGVMLLRFL
jgi:hypothetical protein